MNRLGKGKDLEPCCYLYFEKIIAVSKMKLAPIVLFVYNRPWHTEQTLSALMRNELADQSALYIYADGPKENATEDQIKKIEEVRRLARSTKWCEEVHIIEAKKNKGLADSVIDGVTEIVNKYGEVIVLEDDIITSANFLHFMNAALVYYYGYDIVAGVSGFSYPSTGKTDKVYFLPIGSSWGWGTWKRQWDTVQFDSGILVKKILEYKLEAEFDFGGREFFDMLKLQDEGKLSSWAIRFYASFFLQKKIFIYPPKSLIQNIGFGTDATHTMKPDNFLSQIYVSENVELQFRIPILDTETENVRKAFTKNYLVPNKSKGKRLKEKIISYFKKYLTNK